LRRVWGDLLIQEHALVDDDAGAWRGHREFMVGARVHPQRGQFRLRQPQLQLGLAVHLLGLQLLFGRQRARRHDRVHPLERGLRRGEVQRRAVAIGQERGEIRARDREERLADGDVLAELDVDARDSTLKRRADSRGTRRVDRHARRHRVGPAQTRLARCGGLDELPLRRVRPQRDRVLLDDHVGGRGPRRFRAGVPQHEQQRACSRDRNGE
jgi:hypothetical protein